jgi:CubicO group peptidase (beta-lactamase class C family)
LRPADGARQAARRSFDADLSVRARTGDRAMRLVLLIAAALVIAPSATSQKPSKAPPGAKPTIEGEIGKKLDEHMARVDKEDGGFCGNVIVAAGGKVLLEKGYGIADASEKTVMPVDALWDWASVSKQVTAAAILRLQDKKKLKLDDPIKKHYPEVAKDQGSVTLRQLLNHTSGIEAGFKREWSFDALSRESFEKLHVKLPLVAKPGEKWEYNNSAYAFLAALVERLTKKTFEEYCAEELFKPAGLREAAFIGVPTLDLKRVPKINRGVGFPEANRASFKFAYGNTMTWGYRGCGGTVMTTRDMYLWDRALRGEKVLSKAAKDELYKPALNNYALGWEVTKGPLGATASHSGGVQGVVAYVLRGLDEDFCVAFVCSYEPKINVATLAQDLARMARKEP